jgi:hypothetical protein
VVPAFVAGTFVLTTSVCLPFAGETLHAPTDARDPDAVNVRSASERARIPEIEI